MTILQKQFKHFLLFEFRPTTRKQKSNIRKSKEMDILYDYSNMDVKLGERNSNSIETELDSIINCTETQQDFQSLLSRELIPGKRDQRY